MKQLVLSKHWFDCSTPQEVVLRLQVCRESPRLVVFNTKKCSRWIRSANHKDIGTLYFELGLYAGLIGTSASWLIRLQLGKPIKLIRRGQVYNIVLTSHALLMIFFMVMPTMMGGFGNWLVPLMLGMPDIAFPRVNLLSWWLIPGALCLLVLRMLSDVGSGTS